MLFSDYTNQYAPAIAQLLSLLFVIVIGLCFMCLVTQIKKIRDQSFAAIFFMMVSAIFMVMCARINVPVSYQGSARYIYVIVPLFIITFGHLLCQLPTHQPNRKGLQKVAISSLSCFTLFSVIFTFMQWNWPLVLTSLKAE